MTSLFLRDAPYPPPVPCAHDVVDRARHSRATDGNTLRSFSEPKTPQEKLADLSAACFQLVWHPCRTPVRLKLSGIRKTYPSVIANDGIDLTVRCGEIHAVLGENGAGKSTPMKIIYGAVRPDDGEIRWEGEAVIIANPARARQVGIGMVFQHLALFETLTVAENILLAVGGDKSLDSISRRISGVGALRVSDRAEPSRSFAINGRAPARGDHRCLLQDPKLLILDEPTSVLTPQAVLELFEVLRKLASEGRSILYISHKLEEVKALCHVATVLRAGRVSGVCKPRTETLAFNVPLARGRAA